MESKSQKHRSDISDALPERSEVPEVPHLVPDRNRGTNSYFFRYASKKRKPNQELPKNTELPSSPRVSHLAPRKYWGTNGYWLRYK